MHSSRSGHAKTNRTIRRRWAPPSDAMKPLGMTRAFAALLAAGIGCRESSHVDATNSSKVVLHETVVRGDSTVTALIIGGRRIAFDSSETLASIARFLGETKLHVPKDSHNDAWRICYRLAFDTSQSFMSLDSDPDMGNGLREEDHILQGVYLSLNAPDHVSASDCSETRSPVTVALDNGLHLGMPVDSVRLIMGHPEITAPGLYVSTWDEVVRSSPGDSRWRGRIYDRGGRIKITIGSTGRITRLDATYNETS